MEEHRCFPALPLGASPHRLCVGTLSPSWFCIPYPIFQKQKGKSRTKPPTQHQRRGGPTTCPTHHTADRAQLQQNNRGLLLPLYPRETFSTQNRLSNGQREPLLQKATSNKKKRRGREAPGPRSAAQGRAGRVPFGSIHLAEPGSAGAGRLSPPFPSQRYRTLRGPARLAFFPRSELLRNNYSSPQPRAEPHRRSSVRAAATAQLHHRPARRRSPRCPCPAAASRARPPPSLQKETK